MEDVYMSKDVSLALVKKGRMLFVPEEIVSGILDVNKSRTWEKSLDVDGLLSTLENGFKLIDSEHANQLCSQYEAMFLFQHLTGTVMEGIKIIEEYELPTESASTLLLASLFHHYIAAPSGVMLRSKIIRISGKVMMAIDTISLGRQFISRDKLPLLAYRADTIDNLKNIQGMDKKSRDEFLKKVENELPLWEAQDRKGFYKIRSLMP